MASDMYNTGVNNVNTAAGVGKDAIGSFDPNAWASKTQSGLSDIWNNQNSTQNQYIQGFKNQIAGQPSATTLYKTANDMFNVPTLQANANTLNNTMLQTPNSNINAARGFNFDQNQIDQKTSQDLQRLAPSAQAAQNNANTAMTNAGNYVASGMQQNQYELQPTLQQGQYLMDSYARQQTGFTTVAQQQLQSLQDKMDQGVQLSAAEMSQYTALTQSEQQYQSSLNSANIELQKAKIAASNQVLPQGSTYLNPYSGTAYNPFATPAKP